MILLFTLALFGPRKKRFLDRPLRNVNKKERRNYIYNEISLCICNYSHYLNHFCRSGSYLALLGSGAGGKVRTRSTVRERGINNIENKRESLEGPYWVDLEGPYLPFIPLFPPRE
jgi:hypothetical protein